MFTASDIKLNINDKIGDFTVVSFIGKGSYGDVYYVRDTLGKNVALKLLKETFSKASEREIRGISLLRDQIHASQNLPLIYHVGIYEQRIYYTMDAADNCSSSPDSYCPYTLEYHLKNMMNLSSDDILDLILAILSSLDELHQKKMAHRDIKPDNIIRFDGKWMLTDFGLLSSSPQSFVGSPGFMAPFPEGGLTLQSEIEGDLYSLGKVLYCVFSREPVDRYPLLPKTYTPQDIPVISALYHKACSSSPQKRFHSCKEFTEAVLKAKELIKHPVAHTQKWILAVSATCLLVFLGVMLFWMNSKNNQDALPKHDYAHEQNVQDTRQYQDGFVKIVNRDQEYQILCCFPSDEDTGTDPTSRKNQFRAMNMVKSSMAYYLNAKENQTISIKHAEYLKQPFSERALMVYIYAIRHEDCSLIEKLSETNQK